MLVRLLRKACRMKCQNQRRGILSRWVGSAAFVTIMFGLACAESPDEQTHKAMNRDASHPASSAAETQPGTPCSAAGQNSSCHGELGLVCVQEGDRNVCECPATMDFDYNAGRCVQPRLGQRVGDACGPAGEGAIPFADCDAGRGLRCTRPDSADVDAPATCQCIPRQEFSAKRRACVGLRLGEHPGDPCGLAGKGEMAKVRCNSRRGLVCGAEITEANGQQSCECGRNSSWSENRQLCVVADTGCG